MWPQDWSHVDPLPADVVSDHGKLLAKNICVYETPVSLRPNYTA